MGRCKQCKYWDSVECKYWDSIDGWFPSDRFFVGQFEWGYCNKIDDPPVVVMNPDEEYHQTKTRHDFGCVFFEEKENG